ncbi:hypothetical protein ACS0TY_006986 [Phlomoides rotata]
MGMYGGIMIPIFLFIILVNRPLQACFLGSTKRTVHISNGLPGNPTLSVHCYSGNDDLGNHSLNNTDEYNWSFCPLFFAQTVFHCDFKWANKEAHFEVYNDRVGDKCANCFFLAMEDGFYLSYKNKEPAVYATWSN